MITVEDLKRLDAIGEPIISTYQLEERWQTTRGYLANRRLVGDAPKSKKTESLYITTVIL